MSLNELWASGRRTLLQSRYGALLAGLAGLLILGVIHLTDYGASVDEWHNTYYGRLFLQAYATGNLFLSPGIAYFNGPFYFMVFTVTARLFHALNPGWLLTDGLHLTNFITFLIGVLFFYRISLRLFPRGVALFLTALFVSQPVLFGHAFINQKDTPLMAFFLASVELGWTAVDRWASLSATPPRGPDAKLRPSLSGQWYRLAPIMRAAVVAVGLLSVLLLFDLWLAGTLHQAARNLLAQIYDGRGPSILVGLFQRVAVDAYKTPLDAYMAKLDRFLVWTRIIVPPLLVVGMIALWRVAFPVSFENSAGGWIRKWAVVLVAGCILGMATSIRMLAPLAGLLVAGYWVGRSGRRAIPGLLLYAAVAAATTYLTWPVLWGNPLVAITDRLFALSDFSRHSVLFQGMLYESSNLPLTFLPVLFLIQLTLPSLLFLVVGSPYSWILSMPARSTRLLVCLVWLWFLAPVVAVMLELVPIYNNFRHILFAVPALFLLMGFGIVQLFAWIRRPALRAGLVVLSLVPGLVGILRLHPYEYIYYNELVGGVRGAYGEYDLDYWCTSFRAAMDYVNQVAKAGDRVTFAGGHLSAAPFGREDLLLEQGAAAPPDADFALACRRDVTREAFYPEWETVREVRVDGALLAIVKQRDAEP